MLPRARSWRRLGARGLARRGAASAPPPTGRAARARPTTTPSCSTPASPRCSSASAPARASASAVRERVAAGAEFLALADPSRRHPAGDRRQRRGPRLAPRPRSPRPARSAGRRGRATSSARRLGGGGGRRPRQLLAHRRARGAGRRRAAAGGGSRGLPGRGLRRRAQRLRSRGGDRHLPRGSDPPAARRAHVPPRTRTRSRSGCAAAAATCCSIPAATSTARARAGGDTSGAALRTPAW